MIVTGKAKFVGYRSGSKNGNPWMFIFLDDLLDFMDRCQIYVSDPDLHRIISSYSQGQVVAVELKLSSNSSGGFRVSLLRIGKASE